MTERLERGHCFCGAIAAEFRGEPFWTCFDHDDDCRRAIGAAVVVWVGYRPEQVRFQKDQPKTYSKTEGVLRTFCADCGTSIAYEDAGTERECYFSLGFFDRPEGFRPMAHAYWRMKLPWIEFADRLERIEEYSRSRDASLGYPSARKKT